jgi:predicted methyltransferase
MRITLAPTLVVSLLLAGGLPGCDKDAPAPESPSADAAPTAQAGDEEEAEPELSDEEKAAKEREQMASRLAEAFERSKKAADEEAKRWTDEGLEDKAKKVAGKHKNTKKALTAILASPYRAPGNADRDAHRHPLETLRFFGIKPTSVVVEAGPGGGWYTEVLAPLLAAKGKLVLPLWDPNGPDYEVPTLFGKRLQLMLGKSDALFGKVETVANSDYANPSFGEDGSADVVVVTREMHNWFRNDMMDAWLSASHKVLKTGGVLAVVQHRAKEGEAPEESAKRGRLDQKWLVEKIESAGFVLDEASEINANDKDTKDYERGVWTLPPVTALGDKDKDKYVAIGESDRMTLRFKKKE